MDHMVANQTPKQSFFKPTCTHITAIRVYGGDRVYETCRQHGELGWLYQCTQDIEERVKAQLIQRYPKGAPLQATKGGLEMSHSELSCLFDLEHGNPHDGLSRVEKLTNREASRYRPEQLAKLVRQRQEVEEAIKQQLKNREGAANLPFTPTPCRHMVCQRCRPMMNGRSTISLDAAALGKALPTAVIACGFAWLDGMPIIDASVIKGFPHQLPRRDGTIQMSTPALLQLLEKEIQEGQASGSPVQRLKVPLEQQLGLLKHSPACENLASISKVQQQLHSSYRVAGGGLVSKPIDAKDSLMEVESAAKRHNHRAWSTVMSKQLKAVSMDQPSQGNTMHLRDIITHV